MRILVTRPQRQAEATATRLEARGHEALVDPVIAIVPLPTPAAVPEAVDAMLVTSANACHALVPEMRRVPVFCVGGATAAAVRATGDGALWVADGDARRLARLVRERLPAGATCLHLAGEDVTEGLAEELRHGGIHYRRRIVYAARPVATLGRASRTALLGHALDAVLLFSPRTARLFHDLVEAAGLSGHLATVAAVCISPAVEAQAASSGWRRVLTAARPEESALLARLEEVPD